MGKLNFKNIGMRAAGAAAGGVGGSVIDKMLPNMKPLTRGIIKMSAGVIIPELAPKSKFAEAAGIGLAATGSQNVYEELVVKKDGNKSVSGVGNYDVDDDYEVSGTDNYDFEGATLANDDAQVDGTSNRNNVALGTTNVASEGNGEYFTPGF